MTKDKILTNYIEFLFPTLHTIRNREIDVIHFYDHNFFFFFECPIGDFGSYFASTNFACHLLNVFGQDTRQWDIDDMKEKILEVGKRLYPYGVQ